MGAIISYFITILRAWLGIKADIQQKQAEHVGEVIQTNTELAQSVKDYRHELELKNHPIGTDDDVINKL